MTSRLFRNCAFVLLLVVMGVWRGGNVSAHADYTCYTSLYSFSYNGEEVSCANDGFDYCDAFCDLCFGMACDDPSPSCLDGVGVSGDCWEPY